MKSTLLQHPDLIKDLISQYKRKPTSRHDFDAEPFGESIWYSIALDFVRSEPSTLLLSPNPTASEVLKVVQRICENFRRAIELHGWSRFLYKKNGKPHHESISQVLFYVLADAYCEANNLDLGPFFRAGADVDL